MTTEITPRRRRNKARKGEVIGGGCFVFRRCRRTGRVFTNGRPFEHPDYASAVREAARLAKLTGDTFEVFQTTGTTASSAAPVLDTPAEQAQEVLVEQATAYEGVAA